MFINEISSTRLEPEILNRFHSVVAAQTSSIQRILRYYYAGSTLILHMDLSPLLKLDENELSQLFKPFGDDYIVKNSVLGKTMDLLIHMVCV